MQRILIPARTLLSNRDFVVVLVCNVLLGMAYSFVAPFMSMFGTEEVKMPLVAFGLFMTSTTVSAAIVSTVLARWSDTRYSRRAMLLLGSFCGALAFTGYAFVRNVPGLIAIGTTVLAVSTVTFSQLFAYARELLKREGTPAQDAPLYMNVFRLFFALSWTVGPAIAAWVMAAYHFRGMFLTAAGIFLVLMAMIARFIPAIPPPAAHEMAARVPLRQALRRPDLLAYFTGIAIMCGCVTMGMMNLPLLIINVLGGGSKQIGFAYSVSPVFELPFMFYIGLLASRGDQTRIIRASAVIAVAYYGLLSLVQAPWQIYLLQILNAIIVAIVSGIAITFFQDYLPGQMGTATNLYSNAQRVGSTSGYLVFGVLAHTFGHRVVFGVCAGLCFVTYLLFRAFRRHSPQTVVAAAVA